MNKIRAIRDARGMSCKQVAAKLGCAEMTVSRYERDEGRVTISILRKLARILDVTVGQLLGESPLDNLTGRAEVVRVDRGVLEAVMDAVDRHLAQEGVKLDTQQRAGLYLRIHDFAKEMPTTPDDQMIAKLVRLALQR